MNPLPDLRPGNDGLLEVSTPEGWIPVTVSRCFPWTAPDHFFSLRDSSGKERAFIEDPGGLPPEARAALDSALALPVFLFEIRKLARIWIDIELRTWDVETAQGPRRFQTEMDAWPEALPDGSWLVRDVSGDLYRVPPAPKLDPASRAIFWAFLD